MIKIFLVVCLFLFTACEKKEEIKKEENKK